MKIAGTDSINNKKNNKIVKIFKEVVCIPFKISNKHGNDVTLKEAVGLLIGSNLWEEVRSSENDFQESNEFAKEYQKRVYFHPFVQRFLYDKNRVIRFKRREKLFLKINIWGSDFKSETVEMGIESCELTLFQPDIGILLLKVKSINEMDLSTTQKILDTLRRIYPPYFDVFDVNLDESKDKEVIHKLNIEYPDYSKGNAGDKIWTLWKAGHCPAQVEIYNSENSSTPIAKGVYYELKVPTYNFHPEILKNNFIKIDINNKINIINNWAGHWAYLLYPLCTRSDQNGDLVIRQFGDDRAATMSYIALDKVKDLSRGNWMRFCFADEPGENLLPYSNQFTKGFEDNYCYDRYWYHGKKVDSKVDASRILNCGNSFSYVGGMDNNFFINNQNGALATFSNIYVEMGVIAHFQRAALLATSQKLSEMFSRDEYHKISLPNNGNVKILYENFIEFTQNYWFDEISPQEQGQQLFSMWRKHLRIQELYDEVRQEIKDLVDYVELQDSKKSSESASELNKIIGYFGVAGFFVAFVSGFATILSLNFNAENTSYIVKILIFFMVIIYICMTSKINFHGKLLGWIKRLYFKYL